MKKSIWQVNTTILAYIHIFGDKKIHTKAQTATNASTDNLKKQPSLCHSKVIAKVWITQLPLKQTWLNTIHNLRKKNKKKNYQQQKHHKIEYNSESPQSHTTDQPMTLPGNIKHSKSYMLHIVSISVVTYITDKRKFIICDETKHHKLCTELKQTSRWTNLLPYQEKSIKVKVMVAI